MKDLRFCLLSSVLIFSAFRLCAEMTPEAFSATISKESYKPGNSQMLNPSFRPYALDKYLAGSQRDCNAEKAASVGDSQYLYALALAHGCGVAQDEQKALTLALWAMDKGSFAGALLSAEIMEEQRWANQMPSVALYCKKKAYEGALEATRRQDPIGFHILGLCYLRGYGVSRDGVKGVQCLSTAAQMGSIPALVELAECYRTRNGVPIDRDRARRIFSVAVSKSLDYSLGCRAYAKFLDEGERGDEDIRLAYHVWTYAAENDDQLCCHKRAIALRTGRGVEKNESEAAKCEKRAVELGNVEALLTAKVFESTPAWRRLMTLAFRGNVRAQYHIATLLSSDTSIKFTYSAGLPWLYLAASNGSKEAQEEVNQRMQVKDWAQQALDEEVKKLSEPMPSNAVRQRVPPRQRQRRRVPRNDRSTGE